VNRPQAEKILNEILTKIILNGNRITDSILASLEHWRVFECVFDNFKGGSFFKDDDLLEDFARALHKAGILAIREKSALKKTKAAISLFALTVMHSKTADLGDNRTASLSIMPDGKRRLAIYALSEIAANHPVHGKQNAAIWLFETDLDIASHCEDGVAPLGRAEFVGDFTMTPQLKLARV
jgi:hypothetical protein